ncbi:YodD family peroxide/acid resistance protein [Salmonella enterica]
MKSDKEYGDAARQDLKVDVDALLAAINEISEGEVRRVDDERVSIDGREYHTWRELAEAFELDVHDFSFTEANR